MATFRKVRPLENEYYHEHKQYAKAHQTYLHQRKKYIWWLKVCVGVVIFVTLLCGWSISHSHTQIKTLQQKTAVVKRQIKKQKATNQTLTQQLKLMSNKTYLQQLARQKYYYSKSNETIYSLPSDKTQAVTAN